MSEKANVIEDVTGILTAYALTKFTANALKVIGPIQEEGGYRWRIASTRYKDVTVLARTKARFLQKAALSEITVFGTTQERTLKPNLADLRKYLETAELVQL